MMDVTKIKGLSFQVLQVALIWTGISAIILLKSTVFGPLAELGLISYQDEIIAWLASLIFIPLAVLISDKAAHAQNWIKPLLSILVLSAGVSIAWTKLFTSEVMLTLPTNSNGPVFFPNNTWVTNEARFFQSETLDIFSSLIIITCIAFVVSFVHASRKRELNEMRLEGLLVASNLNLLKSQMHPHFIFNTLNTVSGLMEKDVDEAQKLLENLSLLLRSSLKQIKQQELSFQEELHFLEKYIEIEQARFSRNMAVHWDICKDCHQASLPHMILQPLVENAIKHGFRGIKRAAVLKISAKKTANEMIISIADNGIGIPASIQKGIGLELVEKRLSSLYGLKASLTWQALGQGGTRVLIRLPYKKFQSYTLQ